MPGILVSATERSRECWSVQGKLSIYMYQRYLTDLLGACRPFSNTPLTAHSPSRRAVSRMLSLLAAGMVRGATPSRSAARMCSKAGPIKFEMDFSANWFAAALASSGPSQHAKP